MKIQTVGIDIGKTVFHLGAMDERGKVVVRKRFSRTQLLASTVNLPPCSQTCNSKMPSRLHAEAWGMWHDGRETVLNLTHDIFCARLY